MNAPSRPLGRVIGPTLIALGGTEAINMDIYADQIAPVVYLNGLIFFVVGLALVNAHNVWTWRWPVLVTMAGWAALALGLARLIAPGAATVGATPATFALLALIITIGVVVTGFAYGPSRRSKDSPG